MSKSILAVVVVLVILGGGYLVYTNKKVEAPSTENSSNSAVVETKNSEVVPVDTATSTPADELTELDKPRTFTLAEVATHNTPSNCWTVVNGDVYDVTNWIKKHPGGEKAILGMCGKDATAGFTKKHGGQEKPEATLEGFEIGVVAK